MRDLELTMFDVGQGDALFLETPSGTQMLIDGGPSNAVLAKLGRAMKLTDRHIDYVMLSHPDADHVTGLAAVLERYDVGAVIVTGVESKSPEYQAFAEAVDTFNVPVITVRTGDLQWLDKETALRVLWPSAERVSKEESNNTSIVAQLIFGTTTIVLTGDAEEPVESQILAKNHRIKSDVLKAGHHGSKTSTTEEWVSAVDPHLVLIPVGHDNQFGHPHAEVIERLQQHAIEIHRTDIEGDVRLQTDGTVITVKTGLGYRLLW